MCACVRACQSNIGVGAWGSGVHAPLMHGETEAICFALSRFGVHARRHFASVARKKKLAPTRTRPVPQARRCAFAAAHSCLTVCCCHSAPRRSCCDGFRERGGDTSAHVTTSRECRSTRSARRQKRLVFVCLARRRGEVRTLVAQERSMWLAAMHVWPCPPSGAGMGFRRTRTAASAA